MKIEAVTPVQASLELEYRMKSILSRIVSISRIALSTAAIAAFTLPALPAFADDGDVSAAASALSTKLSSDDTYPINGTTAERQLSLTFATKVSAPCVLTVHRESHAIYPFFHPGTMIISTNATTFYMLPLDTMTTALTVANSQSSEVRHDPRSGNAGEPTQFTFSEDTTVPLAGLKTAGITPVSVSSQSPPMKYPTYSDAAAAKAALAALAKAAASCAAAPATK